MRSWVARFLAAALAVGLGACAASPAPVASLPPAPSATPTPSATPSATPTPTPLRALREQFDDPSHLALRTGATESALFACEDGTYRITVRKPQMLVRSMVGGPLADGTLDVEVSFPRGTPATAAGLIFRQQDEQNFYMASLSSDGFYSLDVREDGVWRSLIEWTNWPTIDTRGGPNHLRVVLRGDMISLYLNGDMLSQASDATFASGDVALGVNTFATADVTAVFDNLAVEPQHTRENRSPRARPAPLSNSEEHCLCRRR